MTDLIKLYKMLDKHTAIYNDAREYARGEKAYATSPYMQEYYGSILPSLKKNLIAIKSQIANIENKIIRVK
jgi:hypothetical protein